MGIAFAIDVLDNTEDALLRVYGTEHATSIDPELRQVVADEVAADHGGGGLAASGRGCAGKKGLAAIGAGHAGNEHVLGELFFDFIICGVIDAEAMVAFLEQQGVAGIGAEGGEGGLPASVHEDAGIGYVLGAVRTFRVDIGEEEPGPGHLGVEVGEAVAVEEFCRVEHVAGRGNLDGGNGCLGPHRSAAVEADDHGHAAHDAGHEFLDVVDGFAAQHRLGQGTHLLAGVDDIVRLVDQARLILGKVEMDSVTLFGQLALLTFFEGVVADPLHILCAAGVDEDAVRPAHGDGVGDLDKGILVDDPRQFLAFAGGEPFGEKFTGFGN